MEPGLMERLQDSPIVRQLLEAGGQKIAAERAKVAKELADLDRRHASTFPALCSAVETAQAAVTELRTALATAEQALLAAWRRQMQTSVAYSSRRAELEGQLISTSSQLIQAFCRRRRDDMDAVRRADLPLEIGAGRMAALRWAIEAGERLKLVADADVPAALARIEEEMALESRGSPSEVVAVVHAVPRR